MYYIFFFSFCFIAHLNDIAVSASMALSDSNSYKGLDRAFCIRMKSTLTKRGCHFKSSGYRVSSDFIVFSRFADFLRKAVQAIAYQFLIISLLSSSVLESIQSPRNSFTFHISQSFEYFPLIFMFCPTWGNQTDSVFDDSNRNQL